MPITVVIIVVSFAFGALSGIGAVFYALTSSGFFRDAEAATKWNYLEVCLIARGWKRITPATILGVLPERLN